MVSNCMTMTAAASCPQGNVTKVLHRHTTLQKDKRGLVVCFRVLGPTCISPDRAPLLLPLLPSLLSSSS
jgi:hypothetical protein